MGAIQTIRSTVNGLDELANLIANPPANRPVARAIGNTGRKVCDAYSRVELAAPLLVGPAKTVIDLVCEPYFNANGIDPPTSELPFEGGQCENIQYRVRLFRNTATGPEFQGSIFPRGPIEFIRIIDLGNFQRQLQAQGSNGLQTSNVGILSGEAEPTFDGPTRTDGQPDNCGNPPSVFLPGQNPAPSPGPFPPGEEPGVDPTGQPFFFIPDIDVPGFDPLPLVDEPLGDEPTGGTPPASGGDGLPGDPDAVAPEAGEVSGGGDGEEVDFGPPPEGKVWVGCIVQTSTIEGIGNIPGTGPQSTVWPSIRANVALKYGSLFGKSERINSKFFDVFRPNTALTVTGCFLQVQTGSTSKVFPISAVTCPVNPCESE